MSKKILYIGYNFSPELTGIGKYSGEMMEWLAESGHNCTVVTSYPYYPQWEVSKEYRSKRFWFYKEKKEYPSGGVLKVYRCPMYVPKEPNGKKRIISDFSFFFSAFLQIVILLFKKRNDFVISVSPSFLNGLLGVFYKKIKKAKHLHHIQDLQIEAASELGMIKSQSVLDMLFKMENYIFKNSEVVSSISETMMKRISAKAKKDISFLPNWTDTSFFFPIKDKKELKTKFNLDKDDKVILYSGAIGEKQGLENILFTAESLKSEPNLRFVICGSGPYKKVLEDKANGMGLKNVSFFPLQPKEDFNDFLNMADVHLVIQKKNASDLVMPSKLTTILSVGGAALVTADFGTDLHTLISKYNIGHVVEAENKQELTNGISHLMKSNDLPNIQKNAHEYANEYLNIDKIMARLDNELLGVIAK